MGEKKFIKKSLGIGLTFMMCISLAMPAYAQNAVEDTEVTVVDEQEFAIIEYGSEILDDKELSEEQAERVTEMSEESQEENTIPEVSSEDGEIVDGTKGDGESIGSSFENRTTTDTPLVDETTMDTSEKNVSESEMTNDELAEDIVNDSKKAVSDEGTDSSGEANSFQIEGTILKQYTGMGGKVTIPDYVTEIGAYAFSNAGSVTYVSIPNSVTYIGKNAFDECESLTTVDILSGSKLKTIGSGAFFNCTALLSIDIPDTVESIGGFAFYNCTHLISVNLPNGLTELEQRVFANCTRLKNIVLDNKIEKIGCYAFSKCKSLKSIEIPDAVKEIEEGTFYNCESLESIKIPDSVKRIGNEAFYGNKSLISVQFGKDLETIGSKVFWECSSLSTIKWNSKLRAIGELAFCGVAITDLTLPNSVITIDSGGFQRCGNLKTVILGNGLGMIPSEAFRYCFDLQEVIITGKPTLIGSNAFDGCHDLVNINIPDSVTKLQYQAFASCISLKIIKLGNGITEIESDVFSGCRNLEALYLPYCLSGCGENVISNCPNVTVYIPSNATYAIQWAEEQQVRYELIEDFKPAAVTRLKAEPYGKNKVRLTWEPSAGAEGYLIYGQKNGTYGYVGMTTSGTVFTDVKALDTDYNFYWVFPYITNSDGKMIPGGTPKYVYAKGIIPAVLNLKPSSVVGGVRLTWTKYADAEGYLIYGIRGDNGKYGYIGMTTKGTTFTDTKAYKTQYNFYWVFPYHLDSKGKMIVGGTPKYVYGRAKQS